MFFQGKYRFLSNFYPSEITMTLIDGRDVTVPDVEHAYQASKTLVLAQQIAVLGQDSPGRAKRLGQKVTLRADWDQVKLVTMRMFVFQKFLRHGELRAQLMRVPRSIIEDNRWHDNYWGRCLCKDCRSKLRPYHNHLGQILEEFQDFVKGYKA